MSKSLGGYTVIRNGLELDYCFREAVASLLGVCDSVVVCDSDSTDGTRQVLDEMARENPKIKICNWAWPNPVRDSNEWFVTWLNNAREHLHTDFQLMVDADEVIHEDSYDEIRRAATDNKALICKRLNFWKDHRHLIPPGQCCGHEVIRVGPQRMWLPTDCPDRRAKEISSIAEMSDVQIHHVGFIRKPEAFFKKERLLQGYFFGSYDERLVRAEEKRKVDGSNWMLNSSVGWEDKLVPFTGSHPAILRQWLAERGYHG